MPKPATIAIALLATSITLIHAKPFKGKIEISLPTANFTAHQRTRAKVTNSGNSPITYCIAVGRDPQGVLSNGRLPEPFYVQIKTENGRWGTPAGCGNGVGLSPFTLKPGESQEYPLNFAATGRMRLVLVYWQTTDAGDECGKQRNRPSWHVPGSFSSSDFNLLSVVRHPYFDPPLELLRHLLMVYSPTL